MQSVCAGKSKLSRIHLFLFPFFRFGVQSSRKWLSTETCTRQAAQTSLTLRSIVLMTESILPLSTCLATLSVKPFTV